jgi:hypothetical protein
MATDHIIKVGNRIKRFQDETNYTSRYVSKNLSSVEKSSDVLGVLYPYTLEFKMCGGHSVYLTLSFGQKFKAL